MIQKQDLNLEKLGLFVIKQAIQDAVKDTSKLRSTKQKALYKKLKKEAIVFLSGKDGMLEHWCLTANLNYDIVKDEVKKVKTNPLYWKEILEKLNVRSTA